MLHFCVPHPSLARCASHANFLTLSDLIKYDTPYLGPRIQLMLSQIQFKLNVEEQYLKGVEKMVQLYQMEGDKKSRADAAARKVESKQKITLLKQALKRYEELHIDIDDSADNQDGAFLNLGGSQWTSTNSGLLQMIVSTCPICGSRCLASLLSGLSV